MPHLKTPFNSITKYKPTNNQNRKTNKNRNKLPHNHAHKIISYTRQYKPTKNQNRKTNKNRNKLLHNHAHKIISYARTPVEVMAFWDVYARYIS